MLDVNLTVDKETFACFAALRYLYDGKATSEVIDALEAADVLRLYTTAKSLSLTHVVSGSLAALASDKFCGSSFELYGELASHAFKIQRDCWELVREELLKSKIEVLSLKGLYFLSELYGDEYQYLMNDVDALIRPSDIENAKDSLERASFSQAIISNDGVIQPVANSVVEEFESRHYELFPFTRVIEATHLNHLAERIVKSGLRHPYVVENGNVFVVVEIDLHHNLSNGFSLEDVWRDPSVFGAECKERALGKAVYEWFLPARFYHEVSVLAETKAKLLADMIVLFKSVEPDFGAAAEIAVKYSMEPSLFYTWLFLKDWVGVPVPEDVLSRLAAGMKTKVAFRDFGHFLPKLTQSKVNYRLQTASTDHQD